MIILKKPLLRRFSKFIGNLVTPSPPDFKNWKIKNYFLRLSGMNISKTGVAIGHGFQCITSLEENIHIDDYATIGSGCNLRNFNEIKIGKFCMIASGCYFTNGGHDKSSFEPFSGPLHIGNGCWIGGGAKIVGSLKIGDNAIIGAGSVVIRDVPPGSIVAGVPAKIIGMRQIPERVWHLGNIYFCPRTFKKLGSE